MNDINFVQVYKTLSVVSKKQKNSDHFNNTNVVSSPGTRSVIHQLIISLIYINQFKFANCLYFKELFI